MIDLENALVSSELKSVHAYFSRILKLGIPIKDFIRYSNKNILKVEKLKSLLLKTGSPNTNNPIVKLMFSVDKYKANVFHRPGSVVKKKDKFVDMIPAIKKSLDSGEPLVGCFLKQVKGGFTVDLGGLVSFMPYSLSGGTRRTPFSPKQNVVQLFHSLGLSLVRTPDQQVFLNPIISRKENSKNIRELLKPFVEKLSESNSNILFSSYQAVKKKPEFRLVGGLKVKNAISFSRLKKVKEIKVFKK